MPAGKKNLLPRMAAWLDTHGGACLLLMLTVYLPTALVEAKAHLLGHDELFTFHIATAPTIRDVIHQSRQIDLHPPLSYLLERWSLAFLHGPRWLIARLSSLIAGYIVTVALFRFTARRLGNLLALVAVGVFWLGPALEMSWQNRSYMLWLAFLALLLLAWDVATLPQRKAWAVPVLFLCAVGTVSSHIFGAATLLPFFVAAFVRWRQTRRADPLLWLALLLPCLITASYLFQVKSLEGGAILFPAEYLASPGAIASMYVEIVGTFAGTMLLLAIILLILPQRERAADPSASAQKLSTVDLALLLTLLAVPALLGVAAMVRQVAFASRYGSAGVLAAAVLTAWFFQQRIAWARPLAVLLVCAMPFACMARVILDAQNTSGFYPERAQSIASLHLDPAIPVVAASALTYVELNDREPADLLARTYYLTDRPSAVKYAHATLFDHEQQVHDLFHLRAPVEPMPEFLQQHAQFYVVGTYDYPDDWLLRALVARGAVVDYRGHFDSSYKDNDLYLVTVTKRLADVQ